MIDPTDTCAKAELALRFRLHTLRDRLRDNEAAGRGINIEVAELLRTAQQLGTDSDTTPRGASRPNLEWIAAVLDTTQGTLVQMRDQVPDDAADDPAGYSNRHLALIHLDAPGTEFYGRATEEFHARYPRLKGWADAIAFLRTEGEEDAARVLDDRYRAVVEALADPIWPPLQRGPGPTP